MSDLISRSVLMQSLRNNVLVDVTPNLERAIDEQPTAYDVDKVVEQLEERYRTFICKNSKVCDYPEKIGCCYDRAVSDCVEIVKAGGIV